MNRKNKSIFVDVIAKFALILRLHPRKSIEKTTSKFLNRHFANYLNLTFTNRADVFSPNERANCLNICRNNGSCVSRTTSSGTGSISA